ncbi:AT-rich interactive domain-containing protein 4A isoform X2 [Rhinoderma darwinii]|uniref:AT-rich interactive domain-containing protein 4A isoform X2 n=1 Tax=Rhinoderma darwinii TaxID=43563 RepID=UPI003F680705
MKAADEPAYLTVGTDVSAKYRGAFCEAKIKTVKRLVKVKVTLKQDHSTQLVQDDQVKGPLRVGATVEMKAPDGSPQEAVISKLTDASWYTVVFDDGDERTLRRTSLCLKGERHFAESETLDQLPLTNPEHFGTPVIGKKSNRGRRSSHPMTEDEKEESSSEEEDDDLKRIGDELLGKVVNVTCISTNECYIALVISPSCSEETSVKRDQCLVRSFVDAKFYSVARKDLEELEINALISLCPSKPGVMDATTFLQSRTIPCSWKMDISDIMESSSSDDEEDGDADASDGERHKDEDDEAEPEEEADPVERDNFLQQLYKFMEDRGTPINKPPVLGYKDLKLFKLFRLVYQQGGCDNIESGAVWKQIYMDLGIPILNSAASYNVKTAYKKYLYGFEEYCRSAEIQFRTIHHNDPRPVEEILAKEEPMENIDKKEATDPPVNAEIREDDDTDSTSENENEKDETDVISPRGRQILDLVLVTKDPEDCDQRKDNNKENKDVEEELDKSDEKKENDTTPERRSLFCKSKDSRSQKQEESDQESDEEDDQLCDGMDDTDHKGDSDGDEDSEDRDCLAGTKVKVKYGRGKTQKIYEANIKSTEVDGGELLYLVHYYGWNVRYDEWVKADRIIWPSEKAGTKRKQKKRTKNKDESDEKEDDDRLKSKRGRPPLKSTLLTNVGCAIPQTPNSENKTANKHVRTSPPDNFLPNGLEGAACRRTRRSSGMYDSDRCSNDSSTSESDLEEAIERTPVKEEILPNVEKESEQSDRLVENLFEQEEPVVCAVQDQETSPIKPTETLQQEVEESEQIVQSYGKQTEQIVEVMDIENLPKKGRRSKTKEPCAETIKSVQVPTEDCVVEPKVEPKIEPEALDFSSFALLQSKELLFVPKELELPNDQQTKEKKACKRKPVEQTSPEKKLRSACEPELPIITAEEKPEESFEVLEPIDIIKEEQVQNTNEEMPSLTAELEHVQSNKAEDYSVPLNEITRIFYKEEQEDVMPMIGPETLVCHEVDLDDFDEKDKVEDMVIVKPEPDTQTVLAPILQPAVLPPHSYSEPSPLALSHDESHSIKSESDITIEVDSVADESQEGLCESESANGFEASTTSSNCSITAQEAEMRDKGHKRISDSNIVTLAKKQKRTPKRINTSLKTEKNGIGELDNMAGAEKIVFLQDKLQEIRKYYMSLKSEVATIDRRRKRLKKKDREVSNTGASMSSASSETGMSPSSSSPPQNTLALECR